MFKNYALGIVLALMFLFSWGGQYAYQWQEFKQHEIQHGKTPVSVVYSNDTVRGEFHDEFWARTFENWQSEAWQVFWLVVLTKYLIFKGSPESRDGDDEQQRQLKFIEYRLDKIVEALNNDTLTTTPRGSTSQAGEVRDTGNCRCGGSCGA